MARRDHAAAALGWPDRAPDARTLARHAHLGKHRAGRGLVVDHDDGYACRSTVTSMRTPFSLGYSWRFPDEQDTDLTWGLEEDGDGTVLTMSHAGLGGLSHSYRDGWLTHLTFLEGAVIGHPLPRDMFWPLHGTFAALHPTGTDPA